MHRPKAMAPSVLRKEDGWLNQYLIHQIPSVASVIREANNEGLSDLGVIVSSFLGHVFHHLGIVHIVIGDTHIAEWFLCSACNTNVLRYVDVNLQCVHTHSLTHIRAKIGIVTQWY